MIHTPTPGTSRIAHAGDALSFELELPQRQSGEAFLRTNLGRAAVRRAEIIAEAEEGAAILGRDWWDLPMAETAPGKFQIRLPLAEVGSFEAKAFFLPEGADEPVWPDGENVRLKVEPADTCAANSIYCAFARQFGANKTAGGGDAESEAAALDLEAKGYTAIPRSGTLREVAAELDHIVGTLGFRYLQLLPIFPTPTTFGRMGRFGSPFAALDFMNVDPALAEFDRRSTPLDQFRELADACHARGAKVLLDIPNNHTGWASWLQVHHPEWFARGDAGEFESPGAWGITWEDLSKLDYAHRGLWHYIASVFLFWCEQGADGFRCDAGYMIPAEAWRYIIARVREQYPDALFFLEGLGGPIKTMQRLLGDSNLNWAYSELFQTYDRGAIERYLPWSAAQSDERGLLIHFSETHDNNRLAGSSEEWARARTALAALCSHAGGFGITNGVEWFAKEKIYVHQAPPLNWGAETNQVAAIGRLNALLAGHPAFHCGASLHVIRQGGAAVVAKRSAPAGGAVLVVVNTDAERETHATWGADDFPAGDVVDLLTGERLSPQPSGERLSVAVPPGGARCLSAQDWQPDAAADRNAGQRLRAAAAQAITFWQGVPGTLDLDDAAAILRDQGAEALCAAAAGTGDYPPVARWQWPQDSRRTVCVPPRHALLIQSPAPFRAELRSPDKTLAQVQSIAFPGAGEEEAAHAALIFPPPNDGSAPLPAKLVLASFEARGIHRAEAEILRLPPLENLAPKLSATGSELNGSEGGAPPYAILTNGRGAMAQVRGRWAEILSGYDCLLGANPHPDFPVDRRIVLARCRAWLVHCGYSQAIGPAVQTGFAVRGSGDASWDFEVPCGMGYYVPLRLHAALIAGENTLRLRVAREAADGGESALPDDHCIRLILRPDIEDRSFHEKTKAMLGPEHQFPAKVEPLEDGFRFPLAIGGALAMRGGGSAFIPEPEWHYNIPHPIDAQRGLGGEGDLFSPGYFEICLRGGESATLEAAVGYLGTA